MKDHVSLAFFRWQAFVNGQGRPRKLWQKAGKRWRHLVTKLALKAFHLSQIISFSNVFVPSFVFITLSLFILRCNFFLFPLLINSFIFTFPLHFPLAYYYYVIIQKKQMGRQRSNPACVSISKGMNEVE